MGRTRDEEEGGERERVKGPTFLLFLLFLLFFHRSRVPEKKTALHLFFQIIFCWRGGEGVEKRESFFFFFCFFYAKMSNTSFFIFFLSFSCFFSSSLSTQMSLSFQMSSI